MVSKKKKKTPTPQKAATFSNRPFVKIRQAITSDHQSMEAQPAAEFDNPENVPTESSPVVNTDEALDEDAIVLSQMMDGAQPIEHRLAERDHRIRRSIQVMDDAELVMRQLDELVHGKGHFDVADTDEYIEASITGLDRRIVKKLRKGDYAVQGHLDLHGMTRDEAREKVVVFIEHSCKSQKKCVLIVHGRGLGSENHIPILKEKLRAWLTRGAIGKRVLAYTSARPFDGGTGAVYVLLRS